MMLSRPRNIVMVCSVVVFCAAVMGCSSSGDGAPADMTVEMPPEEQPPAPPMPSEEDLGLMAAVHTMTEENWSGNQQGESFWSSDAATWWVGHHKYGAVFHAAPWINPDGELEFYVDIGTFPGEGREVQTTPVAVHPGRDIDTTEIGNEPSGVMTTVRALEDHGLGANWQGLQATKVYDGGGTLRVDFYTDADASDNLAQPNVRDDFQHEITLDGIPPSAG